MSCTKRKDGRWQSKVYLGLNTDGKKQYKFVYGKTQKEVEEKILDLKSQMRKGLDVGGSYTFGDVADQLKADREAAMSENDFKTMCARLEPFLDELGTENIKDIRKSDIQPIINQIAKSNPTTGKPSAKRTVTRYITACSAVFENAIENRLIDYNPCRYLSTPKNLETHERRSLTDEERRWIEETPHRAQPAAMLMIYSGLRKGEATALTWDDVNLKERTITVNKSYDFKNHRVKPPKTKAGTRVVSIPKKLVDYLSGLERTCPYVLHTTDNRMLTYSAWQSLWNSYILDLDLKYGTGNKAKKFDPKKHIITIEPFTIHECRHTFCTLMYLAGVDILSAQKQMGHSDVKTTLAIYSHLDEVYKKQNMNKLDSFLG